MRQRLLELSALTHVTLAVRGPEKDRLKAVEQGNSRLRECIDETKRLCEATRQLVRKKGDGKGGGKGR